MLNKQRTQTIFWLKTQCFMLLKRIQTIRIRLGFIFQIVMTLFHREGTQEIVGFLKCLLI